MFKIFLNFQESGLKNSKSVLLYLSSANAIAYHLSCAIRYSLIYPVCSSLYCFDDTFLSIISRSWFPRKSFLGFIRSAYNLEIKGMVCIKEKLANEGKTMEEIAIALYTLRVEKRAKYQLVTPTKEREEIYNRNLALYGDRIAPTLTYLRTVKKYSWEEITKKAMTPDKEINKRFSVK